MKCKPVPWCAISIGLTGLFMLMPEVSFAQHRNDNWFFGAGLFTTGVRFNFGSGALQVSTPGLPDLLTPSFGTISDTQGYLLFSAVRISNSPMLGIYDQTLNLMPGSGAYGFGGQVSSLIFPRLPGTQHFDVIYLAHAGGGNMSTASHLVVDMSLNGGLGDIMPGSLDPFEDSLTAKLTGTPHANGTEYWVLTHELGSSRFFAHRINSTGLDTVPVTSIVGSPHTIARHQGQMYFRRAGDALGLVTQGPAPTIVQLFHFNDTTGEVTYWMNLPGHQGTFGCEFSSDGCKFYVGGREPSVDYIDQYDLCDGDTNAIAASRTRVHQLPSSGGTDHPGGMALAPDGKIYITHFGGANPAFLGVINAPDQSGTACGMVWDAIDLSPLLANNFMNQLKRYHDSDFSVGSMEPKPKSIFSLVPNPAKGTLWLHYPEGPCAVRVTIADAMGRTAMDFAPSATVIQALDISRLRPGLYVVTLHHATGVTVQQRVVVE